MHPHSTVTKILVCDDDTEILFMLGMMLRRHDYEVIPVLNSAEIFDIIKDKNPDMILLDLWMPSLAGDIILQRLKADETNYRIPVIMISASTDGAEIAAKNGADGFIAKPFELTELVSKIKELLN